MVVEQIAEYVTRKGIKQTAIANSVGMTKQAMNETIHGRRTLTADEYGRICEFLEVPYEFFFMQET